MKWKQMESRQAKARAGVHPVIEIPDSTLCSHPPLSVAWAPGPVKGACGDSPGGDRERYCETRANILAALAFDESGFSVVRALRLDSMRRMRVCVSTEGQ